MSRLALSRPCVRLLGWTRDPLPPLRNRGLRSSSTPVPQGLCLERASSAGEPLTPEVNEWAGTALGLAVHDHFGQTEVGMPLANHHHGELARPLKTGSMGRPVPG
ncbi:hypothetical protein [Streptomyces sp. RG80]|uniref:hypothetical protein n=1 Tax=Streptomyces sp. RG80 TaxID=3157340 RepID=UPI00338D9D0D